MSQSATTFFERVLFKYGFATAVAIYLIWKMTAGISGSIDKIQSALDGHISETAYYLRQVCINTAQDEAQRTACIAPRASH